MTLCVLYLLSSVHLFASREFFQRTSHSPVLTNKMDTRKECHEKSVEWKRRKFSLRWLTIGVAELFACNRGKYLCWRLPKECSSDEKVKATHVDTSAMCLCLSVIHRSSSSSSTTSFILFSPIPLVSKLTRKATEVYSQCGSNSKL